MKLASLGASTVRFALKMQTTADHEAFGKDWVIGEVKSAIA